MRILRTAALIGALGLAGCSGFDPIDKFQDWDLLGASKTPLQGERRAVFPAGVPGVPQGVPPDLVKGYQPPAEEPPPVIEAKPEKKVAPRKKAAAPRRQPAQQAEPMQQAPAAQATTTPVRQGGAGMQTMPGAQPTWPADAQPALRR